MLRRGVEMLERKGREEFSTSETKLLKSLIEVLKLRIYTNNLTAAQADVIANPEKHVVVKRKKR
jgi:hypothetical protein